MASIPTHVVNPTFKLDVDGKLFRNKDENYHIDETVKFNALATRLNIEKGSLAAFPDLGLKQHLYKLNFLDEHEFIQKIAEFEEDVKQQIGMEVVIEYEFDKIHNHASLKFNISGFKAPVEFRYYPDNNNIKVINGGF